MKSHTASVPNKKLILHFDIEQVLKIPAEDKDFYVYELCARWVWGKLQRNNKEDPDKVTGWKIAANSLSQECPEAELINYQDYLQQYAHPQQEEYKKLILNLSKGPAAKAKSEIEKNIKNITLPKTLAEAIKEGAESQVPLLKYYNHTGKYQILPAFFKLLLSLKKSKREFAIIVKGHPKHMHQQILGELNLFFSGEHPLFNGRNGTPAVKWDGSKGTKNFYIEESHQTVFYQLGEHLLATYGTLAPSEEKDPEMFKQKFKSFKSVKLCEGPEQIYATGHSLLAQGACIYEANPLSCLVIDPTDYLTQEIYFTNSQQVKVYSCLGKQIEDNKNFVVRVNMFDYLKDVDYFGKQVENLEKQRAAEIERVEKGEAQAEQGVEEQKSNLEVERQSNHAYLQKHLLPVLEGALRQVDLLRPEDPIGFIALYCLKNKERLQ